MSTIRDIGLKIKELWARLGENLFLVCIIVLVGLSCFALGRLSLFYQNKDAFAITYPEQGSVVPIGDAGYVASKTGSTYFFPWCAVAQKINPENKVYFETREDAERAGYRAGNCKGLK